MTLAAQDPSRPSGIVDAHLHVWDRTRAPYGWLDSVPDVLDRAYTFDEIAPEMVRSGVDAAVLIQADDHPGDTALMLETAAAHPGVVGIVASLPLDDPAATVSLLESYAVHPLIVGIRTLSHDHPDPDWLLGVAQTRSLGLVSEAGLTFELVPVTPRHLEVTTELRRRHPDLRLAIDHLGTPPLGSGDLDQWAAAITEVARDPLLRAKASGLYARSGALDSWSVDELRRVIGHAVDAFGPERIMFGSDWPVAVLGGGYARVVPTLIDLLGEYGPEAGSAMRRGTAEDFYGLDLP